MREIRFRGICKTHGVWKYGDIIDLNISESVSPFYQAGISSPGSPESPLSHSFDYVKPETVGQLTGLKDKNGIDIWEGDIVREAAHPDDIGSIGEVKYSYGSYYIDNDLESEVISWDETEVIGNIHDNPELINKVAGD